MPTIPFHPFRIIDHRAFAVFQFRPAFDDLVGFLCDRTVDVLAVLIAGVDEGPVFGGDLFVARHHQVYGRVSARRSGVLVVGIDFHAARRVDTRPDLEYDVVDGDDMLVEAADFNDRRKALAGLFVQAFEAVIGQNPVFAYQRHDVRGDADDYQVEQAFHFRERQSFELTIPL